MYDRMIFHVFMVCFNNKYPQTHVSQVLAIIAGIIAGMRMGAGWAGLDHVTGVGVASGFTLVIQFKT